MNRLKKGLSLLLAAVLVLGCCAAFSACGKQSAAAYELVMITDGAPVNDGAYNESAWNGVKAYGDENNVPYRYYQPYLDENGALTSEIVAKYIDLAVQGGAKTIVLPGEAFAVPAYEVAATYHDIQFVLVDAYPHSAGDTTMRVINNIMCVRFDNLSAGYLAGYLAVVDGLKDSAGNTVREYNTRLGYFGDYQSESSVSYGAGFLRGAAAAADENNVPVVLDYAEYNHPALAYDYAFTIRPVYIPRDEAQKETFKVVVEDGLGSGVYSKGENVTITANPAPEGKVFDHWEVKSNTEGVKDKKVNISHKKRSSMNLLVGDCDCTITAVWADAETVPVTVTAADGITAYAVSNVQPNTTAWVTAPPAEQGMVFDHWECADENAVKSLNSKGTEVAVGDSAVILKPVYTASDKPTFTVTVENGTGSGSYVTDEEINLVANPPEEGYMFYKWENADTDGNNVGIAMDNEFDYTTSFKMVDRFAGIAEKMVNSGTQVMFGGGNPLSDSLFTASYGYDYPVFVYGSGYDESSKGNCFASVVNDYGAAVKLCLESFQGGSFLNASCANNCIYVTGKSINQYQLDENGEVKTDKDGKSVPDSNYSEAYQTIYQALAGGDLQLSPAVSAAAAIAGLDTACLTVNYWVNE